MQGNEIEKARKAQISERQEQGLSSWTDAMDTGEGLYMTRKIIDHVLELQETVSFPHLPYRMICLLIHQEVSLIN